MKLVTNKKAVSLSMNTIIIAIIALIVLVVLVMIFMNTQRGFNTGITSCRDKGGDCKSSCDAGESHFVLGDSWCKNNNEGEVCCIS
ncbi:hypothetical protein JW949_01115 [Candidatus Woesearchaeota archaeon]|nr:hypothetical protein [Candidatus Woesearchaeota archaeon]